MLKDIKLFIFGIVGMLFIVAFCYAAIAADFSNDENPPVAVDSEQFADFMEKVALGEQDLAEGAEIQRDFFNRITPPGVDLLQPMFPSVVPFDDADFTKVFLEELLGEDKNSVAIYPLSLVLDPKTRETLIYNVEDKLIASISDSWGPRIFSKGSDPSRVTLLLNLLPSEDVEQYLYVESRIFKALMDIVRKPKRGGGMSQKSMGCGSNEFGIVAIQKLTNGNMQVTVTNGTGIAELYSYTVEHTSTVSGSNTLWWLASPSFNGVDEQWVCKTTNLVFTNGVAVWEDIQISTNARQRMYTVAHRTDSDSDSLTDGAEFFVYHTNPEHYDSDGDLLPDVWEVDWGLNPCVSNTLTSDHDGDGLSDVDEYRYCTDPDEVDTDGDGVSDYTEVTQQAPTNPNTPDAVYNPTNCSTFTLTVGDPSGSASERWEFVVREAESNRMVIRHMDAGFGAPSTKVYTLARGHYKGEVRWITSRRASPDYDWLALINASDEAGLRMGLVNTACFYVLDPEGLLTVETHGNSLNIAQGREIGMYIPFSCNCNIDIEQESTNLCQTSASAVTFNVTSNSEASGGFVWSSEPSGISGSGQSLTFTPSNYPPDSYVVKCYDADDPECYDLCLVNILKVELTAHRPTTEGPAYGAPFDDHEVPDDEEESPGAGIRINGDTETAANENDLIEVELEVEPFPVPSGVQYFLRRSSSNIKVWNNQQMGTALLDTGTESNITITASPMSVWIENPSGGDDDFELVAKDTDGNDICSDKIHFYDFTSIVIALGGENQVPTDPADANHGIFQLAADLYQQGYDVHMYDEDNVGNDGAGDVYDEIVSAIQDRDVTEVAIFGYSHGGGSTHDLAERLDDNSGTIGTFTVPFTAYLDAVENDSNFDINQERDAPPGTDYHVNYHQEGSSADGWLDGGPIDPSGDVDHEVNVDDPTPTETHYTVDDEATVLNGIESRLTPRVTK